MSARLEHVSGPLEAVLIALLVRCAEGAGRTVEEYSESVLAGWDGAGADAEAFSRLAERAARS
jgi:hypothetical protein